MADDIIRFMTTEELSVARTRYLRELIAPVVQSEVFDTLPEIKSATLCISQFYNDEASDEVHAKWELSPEPGAHSFTGYTTGRHSAGRDFSYSKPMYGVWSGQLWCIPMFASFSPEGVFDPIDSASWGIAAWFEPAQGEARLFEPNASARPWLDAAIPYYLHGDDAEDTRSEFLQWLDWMMPDYQFEWTAEHVATRDKVLAAFERFRNSLATDGQVAAYSDVIGSDLELFERKGPQPYPLTKQVGGYGNHLNKAGQHAAYKELCLAYDEAVERIPPPRAAFRS